MALLMIERRQRRRDVLPLPEVRGLSKLKAAAYVGVSPTAFDTMVGDGRRPKPIAIGGRRVWDRLALDRAFHRLAVDCEPDDAPDPCDRVLTPNPSWP